MPKRFEFFLTNSPKCKIGNVQRTFDRRSPKDSWFGKKEQPRKVARSICNAIRSFRRDGNYHKNCFIPLDTISTVNQ